MTSYRATAPADMSVFWIIWAGQLFSQMGSAISSFGIGIWVFARSGSVQQFALIEVSITLPYILMNPIAGVLADRYDRRFLMILADSAGAIRAVFILVLLSLGHLGVWEIYLSTAAVAMTGSVAAASFIASIGLLVPEGQLGRANGMIQLNVALSQIAGPLIAGALLNGLKLQGILCIDFASFLISISTFLAVRIPNPEKVGDLGTRATFAGELRIAWNYLKTRTGLLHLLIFYSCVNSLMAIVVVVYRPMVLSFASAKDLGFVVAAVGVGLVGGNAVLAIWGGPKDSIRGMLAFSMLEGVCLIFAGLRGSVMVIAVSSFSFAFAAAVANGCLLSILQKRVESSVQGRVFGTARFLISVGAPIGQLLAGPISDRIMEPSLRRGGWLADSIGVVIGTGPGRGIGMLLMMIGCLYLAGTLLTYYNRNVRECDEFGAEGVTE